MPEKHHETSESRAKAFFVGLQAVAADFLLFCVLFWIYADYYFKRPELTHPGAGRHYAFYLNGIVLYCAKWMAQSYFWVPYICTLLIVIIYLANVVTRKVDWIKAV